ncbi:hypothetical protein EV192_105368 [Actinocrispum wychmicini]|uniref:Uncharacterized protein n=1 Tax=Actinocrispum wychmicini TaxID=1213861 RepID=A0A4R2JF17_9PSEU|nr:hypothetical protein EV192_105368 [Actinocrispum wychmicini]
MRRPARRPGEPLSAPGRAVGRGLDRERLAALSLARLRLRLRPGIRTAAGGVRRLGSHLPGAGARRWRVRAGARTRTAGADGGRCAGRDTCGLGCAACVRHGRALESGIRRGIAPGGGPRRDHVRRYPARGCCGVRGERLWQADRSPGGVFRDRRAWLHQPAHRAVRRETGRRTRGGDLRAGAVEGARPWCVSGCRPVRGVPGRAGVHHHPQWKRQRRTRRAGRQARRGPARSRALGAAGRGAGPAKRRRTVHTGRATPGPPGATGRIR